MQKSGFLMMRLKYSILLNRPKKKLWTLACILKTPAFAYIQTKARISFVSAQSCQRLRIRCLSSMRNYLRYPKFQATRKLFVGTQTGLCLTRSQPYKAVFLRWNLFSTRSFQSPRDVLTGTLIIGYKY